MTNGWSRTVCVIWLKSPFPSCGGVDAQCGQDLLLPAGLRLEEIVTEEGFARDPARVQDFYNLRRRELHSRGGALPS